MKTLVIVAPARLCLRQWRVAGTGADAGAGDGDGAGADAGAHLVRTLDVVAIFFWMFNSDTREIHTLCKNNLSFECVFVSVLC